jgi:hypothetical protein
MWRWGESVRDSWCVIYGQLWWSLLRATEVMNCMAVLWLRRLVTGLSPCRTSFAPGSVHMRFVVDKVALEQVFLRVIRFPLSLSFHLGSPYSYTIWTMDSRPIGGRSSETVSPHRHEHEWAASFVPRAVKLVFQQLAVLLRINGSLQYWLQCLLGTSETFPESVTIVDLLSIF